MWNMLEEYIGIIEDEKVSKVHFFDLGDAIEGILRISGLQTIKYGIVESTIKYAQFMATWLNELSKYVEIDYYGTLGNHSEIRPIGTKAGEFAKENMEIIISELLKAYLVNNNRVSIKGNSAIQYVDIDGFKVLATHGQNENNLISSVNAYKDIYNVKVDLMLSGHLHNAKSDTASLNTKVVQFPSIMGIEDYSMKLKKTAKAEGKVILKKGKRLINIDINLQ
jgi:DNA polymerase II small subunit/DNA polymerase delta subunit B